jgi:hypothetical protein
MDTEVISEPEVRISDLTLCAPVFRGDTEEVEKTWKTSISEIKLIGTGKVGCFIERPDSDLLQGGYLRLYEDEISTSKSPVAIQYYSGHNNFSTSIGNDKVDFTKHNYVLCYGPTYNNNWMIAAASAKIFFGQPMDLKLSACIGISNETDSVTSYYLFDSNPLGLGYCSGGIYVREGDKLGYGDYVGGSILDKSYPEEGIIRVVTNTLKKGQTYNVYTFLYNYMCPVAGYTFQVPG